MTAPAPRPRTCREGLTPTDCVRQAILTTKRTDPAYWRRVLQQRAGMTNRGRVNRLAVGSVYEEFSPRELELALLAAKWRRYASRSLRGGALGFRCHLPGIRRVVGLKHVPPDTVVLLDDRKGTGFWSCLIRGRGGGRPVASTVLLIGRRRGTSDCVITFHPGAPIVPSRVRRGTQRRRELTAADALRLGMTHAKVIAK